MVKKETTKEKVAKTASKAKSATKSAPVKKTEAVKMDKPVKAKKEEKAKVSKKQVTPDTGSVDFQVQNFTDKIQSLSSHLKKHPHDFDSRRGLLIMVGKRRRLLNYLKKKDVAAYEKLAASLKLKK